VIRWSLALASAGAVFALGVAAAGPRRSHNGAAGPPARAAAWAVDCPAPARRISPRIYGIGSEGEDPPWIWELGATSRRWGGNGSSRYNWELGNAWNTNHDWYFRNVPVSHRPSFGWSDFLDEDLEHGVATALTVPTLGWVAKDVTSYSFPVATLGPQSARAPDLPDAGNGLRPDGTALPAAPARTSVRSTPESIEAWVRAIRAGDRERGRRRVQLYILDNEPGLWHETHRDVRSEPMTYDELLERTIAYATAIRRADPGATIAGPAAWGWQEILYSAADVKAGVDRRPDRRAHGDLPLLAWWLREVAAAERRTGTRLLDVVDVHFYPQAGAIGTGTAGGTDPAASALRLRSTRSLWDPTYEDESWIGERMALLPLVKRWIEENHPGLGLSVGEWNFGAEGHMSGGLAVAEALGRFGTEGLQSAHYWTYPPRRSPAYWGFRAFRDFDGKGGRFLDWSLPVRGEVPSASLFASADEGRQRVVAVLLNLSPGSPLAATLDLGGCGGVSAARVLRYAGGEDGFRPARVAVGSRKVELVAPPYSITVVEATLSHRGP
jgi:hypothetical protein